MSDPLVDALRAALGEHKVDTAQATLQSRRHDYWVASHVRDFAGSPGPAPACVARPTCVADVQAVLRLANQRRCPVIPFGLGSGVVGGVLASAESIVLDMGAMNAVRFIDQVNLLAGFDAGRNGLRS